MATFQEIIPNASSDERSPSQKYLVDYYTKLGDFLDQAYEEASAEQQEVPEIKQISDSLDYLLGLQWKEAMPSYRAKPVSNELLSNFWETIGLLTDVKPMFSISDIGSDGDHSKVQNILNDLAKGWTATTGFQQQLAFSTMFGMLTSAPAKVYWNPFARGDSGDPSDADISYEVLPAKSLLRLGMGDDCQDDELCIYRRTRTLNWFKRAYPKMGKIVPPEEAKSKYTVDVQTPVNVMPQLFENLSPGMKRMMGAGEKSNAQSIFPKAECREFWMKDDSVNDSKNTIWMGPAKAAWGYWVKPGEKMYPRGRLVVRANRVVLYDEPNPYYHRKKPFSILGLYAVPWQQYAMSVISPWMRQQDILNQMMAGLLQCVKKAINPPLLAAKEAIHPEALRAIDSSKPNLKISYKGLTGQVPSWGQPPNVPTYALTFIEMIRKSMRQSSGAAAMDDAASKKQVPGGDTLDKISFARNTPIRLMGRNLEAFVDEIGGLWTGTALQFYDTARRVELLGKAGIAKEDIQPQEGTLLPGDGLDSEGFVRRWKFKCDKGTLLNVQKQERTQIGFALRKNHDISRAGLYRLLDWNIDLKRIEEELAEEAKIMAAAQASAGAKPGAKKK